MKRLYIALALSLGAMLALAACNPTPVVVVATPIPPDVSFHTYKHPSGVFSLRLPADWSVRDVSRDNTIRVEFSPPGNTGLPMTVYVVNTGQTLDTTSFLDAITKYQSVVNGDSKAYSEVSRAAQGDGSWRLVGVRQTGIGPRQLNTFLQADKSFLSAIEFDITGASDQMLQTMRSIVNTFRVDSSAVVNASDIQGPEAGVNTSSGVLVFNDLFTWTNSQGAFIINGQVTNTSGGPLEAIRVTATLFDAQNNVLATQGNVIPVELVDNEGIAPFTIQFNKGKPSQAVRYELEAAGRSGEYAVQAHLGDDKFIRGNDKASYNSAGFLVIEGDVVNKTQGPAHFVKAIVTVYDEQQRVVATDNTFISKRDLLPGESAHFAVQFAELGGNAIRYVISIEGKSDG